MLVYDVSRPVTFETVTKVSTLKQNHTQIFCHIPGADLVFLITPENRILNIPYQRIQFLQWKEEIDSKAFLPNGSKLPVVLLGNKCDLDEAEIDKAQLDKFCEDKGFVGWFDTSAKLNVNIDKAARFLVERILEHQDIFQKKKATEVSIFAAA